MSTEKSQSAILQPRLSPICDSHREMIEAHKTGGNAYETIILRSLTLRSQDKACPGGKKNPL
jgi:hypothetical protein